MTRAPASTETTKTSDHAASGRKGRGVVFQSPCSRSFRIALQYRNFAHVVVSLPWRRPAPFFCLYGLNSSLLVTLVSRLAGVDCNGENKVQMRKLIFAAIGAVALGTSTAAMAGHDRADARRHGAHVGDRHLGTYAPYQAPYIGVAGPRLVGPATYTFKPWRANPFGSSFFLYEGPACNYIWPYTAWPDKTCEPSNGFHWE
jgi:hypothetical protein